ncbi:MAG: STAS domain-containing protein [Bacteroidetes bacterium]|nr:STAS domain-containing protein [Bacteroidota bacterium]MBS1619171.1 STAS domain-containing protein [Bacteroidota bacterium]MBS1624595.1 STAS domain-containing protein [Bacteroidota bacterium]MBS1685712.1 STAS domain-containing protein [Bacteroidota bacterium]
MKFSIDKRERFCVLKIDEEKLLSNFAPLLKSELVMLHTEGFKNIILDLSPVQFVDSSGLSALLVGNRLSKESGGTFVLTNLNTHIQKLIKISQLESILNIVPTLAESIDFVMMEELDRDLRG